MLHLSGGLSGTVMICFMILASAVLFSASDACFKGDAKKAPSTHDLLKRYLVVDAQTQLGDGVITGVTVYVGDTDVTGERRIKFGVFRQNGGNCTFDVVAMSGYKMIDMEKKGPKTFPLNLNMQSGHYFGFYWPNYAPFGFNTVLGNDVCGGKMGAPKLGDSGLQLDTLPGREYALELTCAYIS